MMTIFDVACSRTLILIKLHRLSITISLQFDTFLLVVSRDILSNLFYTFLKSKHIATFGYTIANISSGSHFLKICIRSKHHITYYMIIRKGVITETPRLYHCI